MRITYVSHTPQQRLDTPKNRLGVVAIGPELFETVFFQEGCAKVCLRVEVCRNNPHAKVGIHPGQVVDERRLSYSALVVKESDNSCVHCLLLITTSTWVSSTTNSRAGLLFFASSWRAIAMPNPKR